MGYDEILWMLQEFEPEDFGGLPTMGDSNAAARAWENLRGAATVQALKLALEAKDVRLEEIRRARPWPEERTPLIRQAWIEMETALASLALEWPMEDEDLNLYTGKDDPETGEPILVPPAWVSQLRQTYQADYLPIRKQHLASVQAQQDLMDTAKRYREVGTLADAAEWAHQRGLGEEPWTTETPLRALVASAAETPIPEANGDREPMLNRCLRELWMDLETDTGEEVTPQALKEENLDQWMRAFANLDDPQGLFEQVWSYLDLESQL